MRSLVLVVAFALVGCMSSKSRKEYEAKKAALAAEEDAKNKAAIDEIRAACKAPTMARPADDAVRKACWAGLERKVPDATPMILGRKIGPKLNGCGFDLFADFEVKGKTRSYSCRFDPKTEKVTISL